MEDLRSRFRGYDQPSRSAPARPAPPITRPKPQVSSPSQEEPPRTEEPPKAPVLPPASNFPPPKKRRSKKKTVFILLLVLVIIGGGAAAALKMKNTKDAYSLGGRSRTVDEKPDSATQTPAVATGTLRFVATGDMIAHDSINQNAKKPDGSYDYVPLMEKMKPYFEKADVRFCNQSTPAGGAEFGLSGYPVFNAPIEFARGIEGVGCNVINLGTNHTNDKGQPLIDATVAAWDNRNGVLATAGANRNAEEQNKVRYFSSKGVKFAILSYSTYTNNKQLTPYGINMYSDALATAQITEARKNADIVVVSMRWGTEYSPDVNAQQDQIAQQLSNLGADIVLGHGPHVLEPVKKLKSASGDRDTYVWYSLGNFLNSQVDIESLVGGFAVMDIDVASKKISKISFMPVYMHYEWTAEQKRRQGAADLAARKNFTMVPLDQATELLAKSVNNTTVQAQTDRVRAVLNKFTEVALITSSQY
jgi:poly-gamma-glutamate capsule biosynthesis protein CapA/YwtB (metallophosphatase superfamily)